MLMKRQQMHLVVVFLLPILTLPSVADIAFSTSVMTATTTNGDDDATTAENNSNRRNTPSLFWRNLSGDIERKTLLFYRQFGMYLNRNKSRHNYQQQTNDEKQEMETMRLDCDYDDPLKIQYCPPIVNPPSHYVMQQRQRQRRRRRSIRRRRIEDTISETPKTRNLDDLVVAPTTCLDSPSDPECRQLFQQSHVPGALLYTGYIYDMPTGSTVTSIPSSSPFASVEPTRDDCYGMMVDGRFCRQASSMPSVEIQEEEEFFPSYKEYSSRLRPVLKIIKKPIQEQNSQESK